MLALRVRTQAALDDVTVATEVNSVEWSLNQQESAHSENDSCECRLPAVPETREKQKKWLPESFDELAVHLEQKFRRLAADVAQMAKELREAGEQAEQLRKRLLDGRTF